MALGEFVWFASLDAKPIDLQSAWQPAAPVNQVNEAAAFTISVETVMLPPNHVQQTMLARAKGLFAGEKELLIASTCQLGSQPAVQRVHYFGPAAGFEEPFTSFVSDTVYLTQDFHPLSRINLLFQLVEVDTGPEDRDNILNALNGVVSKVGAIYPVILPYAFVGTTLAQSLNKLMSSIVPENHTRLTNDINLFPSGRLDDIDLQYGRYIVLGDDKDVSEFQIQPDGSLTAKQSGERVKDFPYIILRIDAGEAGSPNFIVNQRVATLLTQLNGQSNDPFTSSLGFLSNTLDAYTGFTDLQRYEGLLQKQRSGQQLTADEQNLMNRIKARADIKSYLPQ